MRPLLHAGPAPVVSVPPSAGLRSCVESLSPNPGAELIRYGKTKPDLLFLAQGQGEKPTPAFICEAVQEALAAGKTFYDAPLGVEELRQEISDYYRRIYRLSVPVSRIFATGSGTTAMHLALAVLVEPGDEVVAVTPIWKNLLGIMELAQADIKECPMRDEGGRWTLDVQRLFDACTARTRAIVITTPSNPTGWVMPEEDIRAVLDFARQRGIWIIADEVYGRIVYEGLHAPSFLEHATGDDRLFVVNSFSKSWAMTGWRLGWLVGPAMAESHIRDLALYNNMGPPTFTQYGGIAALRHGEDFIREQIALWRGNRDYMSARFAACPRIAAAVPEAAFYSFFRVDGVDDCLSFARRLIDETGLSLAPGCAFGGAGRGYLRLCFAVSLEKLTDALDRLEAVAGR